MSEYILRVVLAIVIGGIIGAEREFRHKAAGFRTIIFICVGACLFTIFSMEIGGLQDPARIAANIVSGVGFLGAGVILRSGGRVIGLTTASAIWLSAALGLGIGAGQYALSTAAALLTVVILFVFPPLEGLIDRLGQKRRYTIVTAYDEAQIARIQSLFRQHNLRPVSHAVKRQGDDMRISWEAAGPALNHDRMREALMAEKDIKEFYL
jgi:putative Mg2+ transporter-C (MgtC) family protein